MRKFLQLLFQNMGLPLLLAVSAAALTVAGRMGRNTIYAPYLEQYQWYPSLLLVVEGVHDGIYPWVLWTGVQEIPQEESAPEETAVEEEPEDTVTVMETILDSLPKDNSFEGPLTGPLPEGVCNPVMQAEDYGVASSRFLSDEGTEYNTDTTGMFARIGRYFRMKSVEPSYFADALFIGDSRTVGLCEYGSMKGVASFLAKESVNVYNVRDKKLRFTGPDGVNTEKTMEEVLQENTYRKVYLCLGVNELGIGTTHMYYEKYRALLEMIREYQPEAIIYIEGIMHVSERYSRRDSARNNTVIVQRNEAVATLANGYDIFYIDMNPYVCLENGNLNGDYTGDGIHLKASAYEHWDRSLAENAIVRDARDLGSEAVPGPQEEAVPEPQEDAVPGPQENAAPVSGEGQEDFSLRKPADTGYNADDRPTR